MPALTMRDLTSYIPMTGPRGPHMRLGKGWSAINEESWVIAATVQCLLDRGVPATSMYVEMVLSPHDRPDLVSVLPTTVVIYEAKRHTPTPADRRQVLRYVASAAERWPDRNIAGYLVWPATNARVLEASDVRSERIA